MGTDDPELLTLSCGFGAEKVSARDGSFFSQRSPSDQGARQRHHIAPPRAFSQFAHDLIRHPRLSTHAVRLLTRQRSLPDGARESLSRTAERARIGACAFTQAKPQLKEEGFVHERRLQGPGGHWVTQQLVSNVPSSTAEATKIFARMPVRPPTADASPQLAPSARVPAVGAPAPHARPAASPPSANARARARSRSSTYKQPSSARPATKPSAVAASPHHRPMRVRRPASRCHTD